VGSKANHAAFIPRSHFAQKQPVKSKQAFSVFIVDYFQLTAPAYVYISLVLKMQ
jgi:hypothetical protein